ncbi:MAG: endonuclease V [Halobacteriaceae archaeon]
MDVVRERFRPDPSLTRQEMEALQRAVAAAAVFADDHGFDVARLRAGHGDRDRAADQQSLGAGEAPVVAGVDQAFDGEDAVSAVVALRAGEVVAEASARVPTGMAYVPGLLSFREAPAVVAALESLPVDPDCLLVDGSGRIHFRQAGLATHVGVLFDLPTAGVAKSLLCGRPRRSLADPLPEGTRVAVEADEDVDAPSGTVIGYAYQSRQYPNPERRHVNPLYVSPGHRLSAETAVDVVAATCAGYKLPEPTRLADQRAAALKGED